MTTQQEDLQSLRNLSKVFMQIQRVDQLEELCSDLHGKISGVKIAEIEMPIKSLFFDDLSMKIISLVQNLKDYPKITKMVEFIVSRECVSQFLRMTLQQRYSEYLDRKYRLEGFQDKFVEEKKINEKKLLDLWDINLSLLFHLDRKSEEFINKSFGYALVDLNGDFIWMDQNSQKFFETKNRKNLNINFFDLMITFSKNYLVKKFKSHQLFDSSSPIGSSKTFSYVIYSKTSMNKFVKQLKTKKKLDEDQLCKILNDMSNQQSVYFKYLKALSSKATILVLKFSRTEFKDIVEKKDYKINVTSGLSDVVKDFCEVTRKKIIEKKRKKKIVYNFAKSDDESRSKVYYKHAILLETRIAKNIPGFNYSKLLKDPKITKMRTKVIKRMGFVSPSDSKVKPL